MGWQDAPIVDDSGTNVPTSQLMAQGMKYTPDQMAAFDQGRGRILASEVSAAQANPGLESPPQAEINNLNPTALTSFNQNLNQPSTGGSWRDAPIVENIADKTKKVANKVADSLGLTNFDNAGQQLMGGYKGALAFGTDLVMPALSWPASGIAGLEEAARTGSMSKGAEAVHAVQNLGSAGAHLADPYAKSTYEKLQHLFNLPVDAMKKIIQLDNKLSGTIADKTGFDPTKGLRDATPKKDNVLAEVISNAIGEPAETVSNFLLWHKFFGAANSMATTPDAKAKDASFQEVRGEGAADSALNKMGANKPKVGPDGKPIQPPMFTVKGKAFEGKGDPYTTDVTPEEMTAEFDQRQSGFNFDPVEQGQTADMFDSSNRPVVPPQQRPSVNMPYEKVDVPTADPRQPAGMTGESIPFENQPYTLSDGQSARNKPGYSAIDYDNPNPLDARGIAVKGLVDNLESGKQGTAPDALKANLEPNQSGLFDSANLDRTQAEQEGSAWERYKARVEAEQKRQAAADAERNQRYGGEDFQPEQQSSARDKILGNKKRYGKQGGAVNMGFADEVAKRIENLKKGLQNISRDRESFGVGDTVRLMNGKTGTIVASKDGRFQIKGKDFMDSVPIQGIDYKYKPAGMVNSSVGYPKAQPHPLGGVGKKQGGAINLRAVFNTKDPSLKPEEVKGVDIPLSDNEIIAAVYKNWNRSSDLHDFKENLRLEQKFNPRFPESILEAADSLYDNFENGYRPDKSVYGAMENLNQRDSADTRPLEQMMKETTIGKKTIKDPETGEKKTVDKTLDEGKLTEQDDLSWPTKELFDPLHIIQTNWNKASGKVFNNVYSAIADTHKFWQAKLKEYMNYNLPMKNLTRKSQINVVSAQHFWDSTVNRQTLIDRGLMWPTREMLMDKQYNGLSGPEADAYLSHAKGHDVMWEDSNITQPKLPGYMSHTWEGAWRVNILDTKGVLGGEPKGLVEVIRRNTRYGANAAAKAAKEKGLDVEVIEPKLGNKNGFITNLEKQIQMSGKYGKLGKAFQQMLIDVHSKALEGTITESLERHGVSGYLGEHGPRPENALMNPYTRLKNMSYNNRLIDLYEKNANDFARAGRNRQIIEGVARPFYRNIERFKDSVNLVDAVDDLMSTATGFRRQEALKVDRWIKQLFVKAGIAPNAPSHIMNVLNGFARMERINSFNVGFAAEHGAFSLPGVLDLWLNHFERGVNGEKQGSFMKALGAFSKDFVTFGKFKSRDAMRAEKWATDNGLYKSNYYDEHQFQGTGGKIANALTHGTLSLVINRMKSVTFQMAYRYYKDIMPESQALEAAKNHTKKTMQSFDEIDRPEIFKEGLGGHSIRTFNQIHLYNMARVYHNVQSYLSNLKDHPIASQKILLPFIGLNALWMSLGGAKGIPFHDDWNELREWIMTNHPNAILPSYEEFLEKHGFPDWAVFGIVPKVTGADIRGTFTFNITNALSGAGLETGWAAGQLGLEKLLGLITGKENPDLVHKNVRKLLPTTLVPWYEDAEAQKLGGNIPKPSKLEGTTARTPEEDLFYKLISKKAISESIRNEHIDLQKEIDARNTRSRAYYTDLIAKKIAGFDTGRASVEDLVQEAMTKDIGFDPNSLREDLKKKLRDMNLPSDIRYIEKAINSSAVIKANKFNSIDQITHGGQLGR